MNTTFSHSSALFDTTRNGTLIKHQLNIFESANRQLSFNDDVFLTPIIFDIGQHHMEMEYIKDAVPLPMYFSQVETASAMYIIDNILTFVASNRTYYVDYSIETISNKVTNIITRLQKREYIQAATSIVKAINKLTHVRVVGGKYHGDLTFSNILITPNKTLYLIDFLPGYMQSPELDYVKLLQESKLKWSKLLCPALGPNYDAACEYLSERLNKVYLKRTPIIEAINYLRILPYVKNDAIGTILCNEINNVLQ